MFLAVENSSASLFISMLTIALYFCIMYLKKKLIGQTPTKLQNIINIISNIVILAAAGLVIMLARGNFSIKEFFQDFILWAEKQTESLISSVFVIIITITVYNTMKVIVKRTNSKAIHNEKRRKTLSKVLLSFARYAFYIVDGAILLSIWGIDITPVLAGLGIAGLVIGLGAQKLIIDFISGMFIVFERHFDVGDIISIDDFKGEVIDIGLKTTKIRDWRNQVKLFSNGSIDQVVNYSLYNSVAVVEIRIPYTEKVDSIIALINTELPKRLPDSPNLLTTPAIVGVVDIIDNSMNFRITATTISEQHYAIEREIRKTVKLILEEHNINYPQREVKLMKDLHDDGN